MGYTSVMSVLGEVDEIFSVGELVVVRGSTSANLSGAVAAYDLAHSGLYTRRRKDRVVCRSAPSTNER
ncbi:hypothetical protein Plhal304r1_c002g0008041 [Plasmopara halstedii]